MISALVSVVISAVISVGALFLPHEQVLSPQMQRAISGYVKESLKAPNFGTTLPIAGATYNLSGAGVSQTGTSITLASFTLPQNGYKIQDGNLSDTFYITMEPGNSSRQEIVSCTTDTQNANGSATFSGCTRGLSPISPYTASSSLRFSHGGGTQVIFSNPPQFYNQFAQLENTAAISGTWTFADSPLLTTDCTVASANNEICAKAYIDGVSVAGASNANETTKGIVESATQIEMASSTSLGATGASLYVQSKYATSTPGSAGLWAVITRNSGKIAQAFLDLTESFTFSNAVTMSATTTMAASNASTTALVLNGLPYQLPATRGASSTVLTENGYGHLVWQTPEWRVLVSTTTTGLLSTTTVPNIPNAKILRFVMDVPPSVGNSNLCIKFNSDVEPSTYAWYLVDMNAAVTSGSSVSCVKMISTVLLATFAASVDFTISNTTAIPKIIKGISAFASMAQNAGGSTLYGQWSNSTTTIYSISVGCGTNLCPIGTQITIWGSNF